MTVSYVSFRFQREMENHAPYVYDTMPVCEDLYAWVLKCSQVRMEVEDLFTDLADGRKLLKLLEIISGEKLGKPNNGKMRVHRVENVNKSLAFLHTKVRLESIGAEDIVDGNPRLILGLIWTIILRFQIQEIEIDVDEENESSEKKSAKDALLLWCQRKTNGYPGVNIQDFSGSWRSGLGFNALIHAHRPDLIDFEALQPTRHIDNLNNAFDIANNELGIPRLLDAEGQPHKGIRTHTSLSSNHAHTSNAVRDSLALALALAVTV
uniref:Calponin-homology (CH) domain-containing protein n=1 Tax=Timema monikensis TaxID=170555 RepID=A0A7R9HMJ0_9NEOP|nr:unnamed protein product [Timema monikensis]